MLWLPTHIKYKFLQKHIKTATKTIEIILQIIVKINKKLETPDNKTLNNRHKFN